MTSAWIVFVITAYSLGCDAPGPLTASGVRPVSGYTIAADRSMLPFGSIVYIEGVGERIVHDVGGAIKGNRIDLYLDDCRAAKSWGVQKRRVRVVHKPSERRVAWMNRTSSTE